MTSPTLGQVVQMFFMHHARLYTPSLIKAAHIMIDQQLFTIISFEEKSDNILN